MVKLYITTPTEGYHLSQDAVKIVEEKYKAKYIGPWCTRRLDNDSWNDIPVDVFYQPDANKELGHSDYFGIYVQVTTDATEGPGQTRVWITKADSAFSSPITGVICDDGEVIVSRYRRDCVVKDGYMIDGGRDYVRRSIPSKLASITVDGPNFIIKEIDDE